MFFKRGRNRKTFTINGVYPRASRISQVRETDHAEIKNDDLLADIASREIVHKNTVKKENTFDAVEKAIKEKVR